MTNVHRVWLGPDRMPEEYTAYMCKWSELNPKDEIIDYYNILIDYDKKNNNWINISVIDDILARVDGKMTIEAAVQIADVVGYELIYNFGGLYVNCDIEPIRSIEYMYDYYQIPDNAAFAVKEDMTTTYVL
jgi:mannosyltransferase OCH1-like enzyme